MTTRRTFIKSLSAAIGCTMIAGRVAAMPKRRPNVLFIAVDDLRTELGCYGNTHIKSPNIDRLAKSGIVFDRAYCQQPICMASRASLLSGYRPDHATIYSCRALDDLDPDALTLNKHFEQSGYAMWASGKIYHHGVDRRKQWGEHYFKTTGDWVGRGYLDPESKRIVKRYAKVYEKNRGQRSEGRGPAFESPDVPDNAYADGKMTEAAVEKLHEFAESGKPFFMAVGYHKPHLPFNAPKKYWDLYSDADIELADNPFLPKNATKFTPYNFGELRNYYGIPKGEKPIGEKLARTLKHGYYACVSYTDALIGKLLDALEKNNLRHNTIIVLWGDHGWKLGEHGMWCKHTEFELDAHAPLMFSYPGMTAKGKRAAAFAEFVDIYPTLCELAGLDLPAHLEGDSLVPAMEHPKTMVKKAAFTQWPKSSRNNPQKVIMGYTLKYKSYSYTEWTKASSGEILARELYDHAVDPAENENIAGYEQNKSLVAKLSLLLDGGKGWKNFRPSQN